LQQPASVLICWSFRLVSTKAGSCCPLCFCPATRRHSQYTRVVADLPCAGLRVQLMLHVRRFFCDTTDCISKIATRTTSRLRAAVGTAHGPSRPRPSIAWLGDLCRVGNPTRAAPRSSNVANNDPSPSHGPSNSRQRTGIRAWERCFLFASWEKIRHHPGRHAKPPRH
jgi:hypothetical protein